MATQSNSVPANIDFEAYARDTFIRDIMIQTKSGATVTPVDLALYTAKMEIREKRGGSVIKTLTEIAGITLNYGAVTGQLRILISATDMAAMTTAAYVYDLQLTLSGVVKTYLVGNFKICPDVTA